MAELSRYGRDPRGRARQVRRRGTQTWAPTPPAAAGPGRARAGVAERARCRRASGTSSGPASTAPTIATPCPTRRSLPRSAAATRPQWPDLHEGETVLDLGSGGGIDVLLSARRVGPAGKAYGLDMTDEMLELARHNQRQAGAENVEFLKGTIEEIPLPDDSVDVDHLQLRDQSLGRQARGASRGGARPAARRPLCRDRHRRRPRHGRGDPPRHAAVDRLRGGSAHRETSSATGSAAAGFERVEIERDPSRPSARRLGDRPCEHAGRMTGAQAVHLKAPQELYEDWERSHWAAQDVDLSPRPSRLGGGRRRRARAPVLRPQLADGRRGADLDPVLRARPRPGRRGGGLVSVDPARRRGPAHAVLRALPERGDRRPRFDLGARRPRPGGPRRARSGRSSTKPSSTPTNACAGSPRDREAKVDFVTIYHMVIEGTLGPHRVPFPARLPSRAGAAPRLRRRLRAHRGRRAAPPRLRDLVPARGGRRRPGDGRRSSAGGSRTCCRPWPSRSSPPSEGAWDVLGVEDGALAEFGLDALQRRRLRIMGVVARRRLAATPAAGRPSRPGARRPRTRGTGR